MSERGVVAGIGRMWRNAPAQQRIGLAAFVLILAGLLALTAAIARRPHFGVLYASLNDEDAAKVVARLRDLKTPYRIAGGGTIEVPVERIAELRLDLAADGLPTGGQAGFELFDRSRLGLSEFGERLNYQRALQGELARTIAHLDPVEEARVHISLPRERLYSSEQQEPSASVVLKLRGGQRLNAQQVRSIVHLVSGAVEGMRPEGVTILDTQGRLLSSGADGASGGLTAASDHLELQREYERQVEETVQSMLDNVLGQGKSVVRASATLDFDQVQRERETYDPGANGSGVMLTRRETRETYTGGGDLTPAGIPGVSSNIGSAQPLATRAAGTDHYERTELNAEYRLSREVERRIEPPGRLERLSLSVFVDEGAKLGDVKDLKAAVIAAAGLDPSRGDQVVVTRIPFTPEPGPEKAGAASAVRDFYSRVGQDFAAIALAAVFLFFVLRALRRPAPEVRAPAPPPSPQPAQSEGPPAEPDDLLANFDLERGAAVLRQWLAEDAGAAQPEEARGPAPAST